MKKPSLAAMLRVSHAGEYGAVRIYQGQQAALRRRSSPKAALVADMQAHEQQHLEILSAQLLARRVRPSLLMPLWHGLGYALGYATASMGDKAAMACTMAVEEVIDTHYAAQTAELADAEPALAATLEQFRQEEAAHAAAAAAEGGADAPGYPLLRAVIQAGSKMAIATAQRI